MFNRIITILMLVSGLYSCRQSDPPAFEIKEQDKGDISFSGYEWYIKSTTQAVGPGPNIFSGSEENIWVDSLGYLHLKITKNGNEWHCSEVISTAEMKYGTYVWTVAGDLTTFNEKAVLGLFSWNSHSFQTQANSEVDIEFSRWGEINDSTLLTYSNQPVWFSITGPYQERSIKPSMEVSTLKESTTHAFVWTSSNISWYSYKGDQYPGVELIASWEFDNGNPPRRKYEGTGVSDEIIIPAPEDSTNARMNLWLLNGEPPADESETEVVIKSFEYIPL